MFSARNAERVAKLAAKKFKQRRRSRIFGLPRARCRFGAWHIKKVGMWGGVKPSPQNFFEFLPRCMECRRGPAMKILSVRLGVGLSVKRVDCDKTGEKSVQIFLPFCHNPRV